MDSAELIETLQDLKETRCVSSESEAMIKPFIGLQIELTFSFIESNSTFGTRLGEEFQGGVTVIAQFENTIHECSILFPKAESKWVKNLNQDDKFTQNVTVLKFDNLYQLVVFGKSSQVESEPVENAASELSTANDSPPVLPNVRPQDKLEGPEEVQKKVEEIEAPPVFKEPPFVESEIILKSEIEDGKFDAFPNAEFRFEENLVSSLDEELEAKEESNGPAMYDDELTPASDEVGSDMPETSQQSELEKTSPEQGQENQEGQTPPPLPQNSEEQERVEMDHHYFVELRNKRYEFGADSLTEKEKAALAQDLKDNAASREIQMKKNLDFLQKACLLLSGILLIILISLN